MLNLKIGILGSGTMGIQLSALLSYHDVDTVVWNRRVDTKFFKKLSRLIKIHTRFGDLEKKISQKEVIYTVDLNDLSDCDIIIETITEDKNSKISLLEKLDNILINPKVIATNTSTFSIKDLAKGTKHQEIFVGTHFFNPVLSLKLVEVIKGNLTSEKTIILITEFLTQLGKTCIHMSDSPGFVVNRLLFLMINEAVKMIEADVSDAKSIDTCMKLGANHSMGPLELADLIGLDVCLSILNTLYERTQETKYKPSGILVRYVNDGRHGKKSGKGFYNYKSLT